MAHWRRSTIKTKKARVKKRDREALLSYQCLAGSTVLDFFVKVMTRRYNYNDPTHPLCYIAKQVLWSVGDTIEKRLTTRNLTRTQRGLKRVISRCPSDIPANIFMDEKCYHADSKAKTDINLSRCHASLPFLKFVRTKMS